VAARLREGRVIGVDPSELMVRHAAARNRRAIAQGRAAVHRGATPDLSRFGDASFDRAYGTHVVYFWSDPPRDLAEIARVLRPGGRLVLGFFAEGDPCAPGRVRFPVERAAHLLEAAGFEGVERARSARLAFVRARRADNPHATEE
jgi:SAM-dependent methyltransferase